jgi:hypothetical protein
MEQSVFDKRYSRSPFSRADNEPLQNPKTSIKYKPKGKRLLERYWKRNNTKPEERDVK